MTRVPVGERVAALETRTQDIHDKLEKISDSICKILDSQEKTYAELVTVKTTVDKHAPNIEIVSNARIWGLITVKIGLSVMAVGTGIATLFGWVKPYVVFPWMK